jgi:hypothetical protein
VGRLDRYIRDNKDKPFDWETHNCLTFVDGLYKVDQEWLKGFSNPRDALKLYRRLQDNSPEDNILDAFDNLFEPVLTLHPQEGWIVFRPCGGSVLGGSFGLYYRNSCVFVGEKGLEFTNPQNQDLYWKPE